MPRRNARITAMTAVLLIVGQLMAVGASSGAVEIPGASERSVGSAAVRDTAPAPCTESWTPTFSDVAWDHLFCTQIEWAAARGVTGGYLDGTFRPTGIVTRGQLAAFLFRYAAPEGFESPDTATFPDVSATHQFFDAIEWAAATGIVNGYVDGSFGPENVVTRGQAAQIIYLFAAPESFTAPTTATFPDVPTTHLFFTAVEWASSVGITSGFLDGTFRPADDVTRQAAVAFLHRTNAWQVAPVLMGTVTSDVDGEPLAGIEVLVRDSSTGWLAGTTVTAADGSYTLTGIPEGTYLVRFIDPSGVYAAEFHQDAIWSADASPVLLDGAVTIDASLAFATQIAGVVTSASSGLLLPGVEVTAIAEASGASLATTTTGADGAYVLQGLSPGDYHLRFVDPRGHYHDEYFNGVDLLDDATPVSVGSVTVIADATLDWIGLAASPDHIVAGEWHTCALLGDGTATCWGNSKRTPVPVTGLTDAVAISAGRLHTCALLGNGTAKCWGNNWYGQLGDGTTTNRTTPVAVAGLTNAVAISAGTEHSCAVLADGTANCWGRTGAGEGTVSGLTNAVDVAAGYLYSCAVLDDGTAKCWGQGVLGDGTTTSSSTPVTVAGLTDAVAISAGREHTCAVLNDGAAKCWGNNNFGQLGDGTTTARTTPVTVSGLTDAVSVTAGGYYDQYDWHWSHHSCAVLSDGTAKCWGNNSFGHLGDGTTTNRNTPVTVSGLTNGVAIAAGAFHSCALLGDSTAACWGRSNYGQLGDGTSQFAVTPVTVIGLTEAVAITGGDEQTCALLDGGTAACWGSNNYGQLGDGTTTDRSTPAAVSGLTNAVEISAGDQHTCAVLDDGTAKCWGNNGYGRLGDSVITIRTTPVTVTDLTSATSITAGREHTCALLADGTAACWGRNNFGQLGDSTTTTRVAPVAVTGLTGAIAITAGREHTCAVLADGTAACWGRNNFGQLGDGTTTDRTTPVAVDGLTDAVDITAGREHTCAVLADGTARCWGNNFIGQLGDGTRTNRPTPVAVSGLTGATALAAGMEHTCALLDDGTARCWGYNEVGQLGDGTAFNMRTTPVAVSGLTSAVNITTGSNHTCAAIADGTAKCWGNNFYGQLGDGYELVNPLPTPVLDFP